jgi:hypothetical protein
MKRSQILAALALFAVPACSSADDVEERPVFVPPADVVVSPGSTPPPPGDAATDPTIRSCLVTFFNVRAPDATTVTSDQVTSDQVTSGDSIIVVRTADRVLAWAVLLPRTSVDDMALFNG